jgi:acetyltransferase-like isoleucine patch superfamily enzyme
MGDKSTKVRASVQGGGGLAKYRQLIYGDTSAGYCLRAEAIFSLCGGMPGAAGLILRKVLYPSLLGSCGKGTLFGRNITFRHPRKIRLGADVVIDDGTLIDAKGAENRGITAGNSVFIGRGSLVYCKGGDIDLGDDVNISSHCTLFSSNSLTVGNGTIIGAYSYLLSGGEYEADSAIPFCEQSGMNTKGPLDLGSNCWLGARVTLLDGVTVGEHTTLGAGAVVTSDIPANSIAVGVPARVVKQLPTPISV